MNSVERKDSLDHLVPQVCRLHHTRAQSLFTAIGLHRGQPFLLSILWEKEGVTHSELAERLHVTPATITKMLRRMEETGFVTRQPDPDDQRVSRVFLTEQGRAVREKVREAWEVLESETFAGLNESEREVLHGLLSRVRENLLRATGEKPVW